MKTKLVIGITGSVAVGKTTFARALQSKLQAHPDQPTVAVIATDGFLYPNKVLAQKGLMERKGFPESYDNAALQGLLHWLKGTCASASRKIPQYDHGVYDVLGDSIDLPQPDVAIIEGVNVLQLQNIKSFIDLGVYIDAPIDLIKRRYLERFMHLREQAKASGTGYYQLFAQMSEKTALQRAESVWHRINAVNLKEHILPSRTWADVVVWAEQGRWKIEELRLEAKNVS